MVTSQMCPVVISWLAAQKHARGGTLDLLMTNVPDLVQVAVIAHIGNLDHFSLSAVMSLAQEVPNFCVSKKFFFKHHFNWNTVGGEKQDLPWHNIWLADNPVEVLNEHLSQLVGHYTYQNNKVIRVQNKDKPWLYDQCRCPFDLGAEGLSSVDPRSLSG